MAAEGAALEEEAHHDRTCEYRQQQIAGAARRLDDAEDVIGPGDEQERQVDDPDAVLLEQARHLEVHAGEALEPLADHRVRADRAPEAREEEVGERQQRPPQDPDDGRAEVVLDHGGTEQRRQHHGAEDDEPGKLEDTGIPSAAEHAADPANVEQVRFGAGRRERAGRRVAGREGEFELLNGRFRRLTGAIGKGRAAPRHPGLPRWRARRPPCGAPDGASSPWHRTCCPRRAR